MTQTYGSYLKINELLALQSPLGDKETNDELLFILIHQIYELWFKQIHKELTLSESLISESDWPSFLKAGKRLERIFSVLIHQLEVLETMAAKDFSFFRHKIKPASGFQSFQFRLLEFRMGVKNKSYLEFYDKQEKKTLLIAYNSPTLHDIFLKNLSQNGFFIPDEVLNRDISQTHKSHPQIVETIKKIYLSESILTLVCDNLLELDALILKWRWGHRLMVERIIGKIPGTGGSTGVNYLEETLVNRFFPELWDVKSHFFV
jgi:tryptophan 2,3-dioxygenase